MGRRRCRMTMPPPHGEDVAMLQFVPLVAVYLA
jgi:hypothetical protein